MTPTDVQKIAAEVREDKALTPAQVLQGVRTLVHAQLQLEQPVPHPLPQPTKGWKISIPSSLSHQEASDMSHQSYFDAYKVATSDAERNAIHQDQKIDLASRRADQQASVPKETHVAFQLWRASDEGRQHPFVQTAIHFAQFNHGRALWIEADKLVVEAGVK